MKIAEKLDELRNNILRDRSALIAGPQDTLWSDETLLRYIKDGERRFARQALIIRDASTPLITRVTLRTGVKTYALHNSVIGVLSARYDTDEVDLARSGHSVLNRLSPPEALVFDPASAYTTTPGRPLAYYTDEALQYANSGRVTLTVFPAPSAAENGKIVYLRVIRLPVSTFALDKIDSEDSEIPENYELDPLEWAAYRAQSNSDADGASSDSAARHKAAFDAAVVNALKEMRRATFVPMQFQFNNSWSR